MGAGERGPYGDERHEYGGLPTWYFALDGAAQEKATGEWLSAVLMLLKPFQVTSGGPVLTILTRAVPESSGWTGPASLSHLMAEAHGAGLSVPMLTANAPAARDNSRQVLANLLDSISFYEPPSYPELGASLLSLRSEENGPPVISALPGRYTTERDARHSADLLRVALAQGAGGVMISDFAPGADGTETLSPGGALSPGVVETSDFPSAGYEELRLIGDFLNLCGSSLAHAGTRGRGGADRRSRGANRGAPDRQDRLHLPLE